MSVQSTTQFEFGGKTYTVNFPNNRQYIQIHNNKATYANHYAELRFMGAESQYAESLVDTFSHLQVLIPELIKDLTKGFLDLTLVEGVQLVNAYGIQIRPWYNENLNFIFGVNKEDDSKEDEDKQHSQE